MHASRTAGGGGGVASAEVVVGALAGVVVIVVDAGLFGSGGDVGFAQAIEDSGLATHVWTGPFIQTDFGTDKYTDELW